MIRIVYSKRKTVVLSVSREGEAVVRAPIGVDKKFLSDFLERHAAWLERQLKKTQSLPKLNLQDGATISLFGDSYRINTGSRAHFSGGVLYLPKEEREGALTRLLKRLCKTEMEALTERLAKTHGLFYTGIRISSARGRWGSCNKEKHLSYSFRLALLPLSLCEYVAAHELSHTVHLNHSAAFWQKVESILPDMRTRRKQLKSYSYVMNYL